MKNHAIAIVLHLAALITPAFAAERIELDETAITGNREQPRITLIFPWQAAPLPAAEQPPLEHLIDEALTPLERDVQRRRIRYYYQESTTTSAPPSTQ